MQSFNDLFNGFKTRFNQNIVNFLFKFTALGKLLNNDIPSNAWNFFNAYNSSWWLTRLWFNTFILNDENQSLFDNVFNIFNFLKIENFFNEKNVNAMTSQFVSINHLLNALLSLKQQDLITQATFEQIVQTSNDIDIMINILLGLKQKSLLTETNIRRITEININSIQYLVSHQDITEVFGLLLSGEILTQVNFDLIFNHQNFKHLMLALSDLNKCNILTQDHFNFVIEHRAPYDLTQAISILKNADILDDANRFAVIKDNDPYGLAQALCILERADILDDGNRNAVIEHDYRVDLAGVLCTLKNADILNDKNRELIMTQRNRSMIRLVESINILMEWQILTQENFEIILNNPVIFDQVIWRLDLAGILNPINFNALIQPNHHILWTEETWRQVWSRIPEHFLTDYAFQRILTAAEHEDPMGELGQYVNIIIGRGARAGRVEYIIYNEFNHTQNEFNNSQSTHTTSVHRSVSDSAIKLMTSYGDNLNLEAKIQEVKAFLNRLPYSAQNQAAKRCIERLTANNYSFIDSSKVSTRQLLALAYIAIHDKTKVTASLEDAEILFVEGLYEIQRGYNLDAQGVDDAGIDKPICCAGTFNKLMEKLNGIHVDVEVYYISLSGASAKFPRLAAAFALERLKTIASPTTAAEYLSVKTLLNSLELDESKSIEPIWESIKNKVSETLWEEFKEAFANGQDHKKFTAIIENGQYLPAPDMSVIKTQLMASSGYQAFLNETVQSSLNQQNFFLNLVKESFWAHRHLNSEAQHVFDKQYGLIIMP